MSDTVAQEKDKTIHIALAMSGAISAGAYSAGVLDFLIEALDEWEKAKQRDRETGRKTVPHHSVVIAGMTGASAGAITSTIGALAAGAGPHPPVVATALEGPDGFALRGGEPNPGDTAWHVLPALYRAWVDGPSFTKPNEANPKHSSVDPIRGLLDVSDLEDIRDGKVEGGIGALASLLNAKPLLDIGDRALDELTVLSSAEPRPYIAKTLHVLLTQTNTRGIPYRIKVNGGDGSSVYGMMNHLDHAHFALYGLGDAGFVSPWGDYEACWRFSAGKHVASDLPYLWDSSTEGKANRDIVIRNTLASGAFPVGLAAIQLNNPLAFYKQRAWTIKAPLADFASIQPDWPWDDGTGAVPPDGYRFAAVDGGALNNDPFDLARFLLMKDPPNDSPTDAAEVDRIVVMISPFPEPPKIDGLRKDGSPDTSLKKTVSRLSGLFVNQGRFRPDALLRAAQNRSGDLWRVSPSRYALVDGREAPQEAAIACGLWGGFGGFLDIEFRRHDYELGRRNGQAFLRNWFGLPAANGAIDTTVGKPLPHPQPTPGDPVGLRYPIIPLCGSALVEVKTRTWPTVDAGRYKTFLDAVRRRCDLALRMLIKAKAPGWVQAGLWAASAGFDTVDWLVGKAMDAVKSGTFPDLVRRDQMLTENERRVLERLMHDRPGAWFVTRRLIEAEDNPLGKAHFGGVYAAVRDQLDLPGEIIARTIRDRIRKACAIDLDERSVQAALDKDAPVHRTAESILAELTVTGPLIQDPEKPFDPQTEIRRILTALAADGHLAAETWYADKSKKAARVVGRLWSTVSAYRYVGRDDADTCD